jgi:hypothetical protein
MFVHLPLMFGASVLLRCDRGTRYQGNVGMHVLGELSAIHVCFASILA